MTTELPTADQELHMPTATERCFGTRDVLRHAKRCSGTATGDVQPKVLRHCDRRRTAEGAPAREAVLRHCDRRRTAEGAPALRPATYSRRCSGTATGDEQPKVLRHAKRCSGTATGDVQPKVLRHARCSGTRCASAQETQGHATAMTTGRDHGRLRTTAGTRECDTRLRFSSGRLPVSSTPLVHMALRTRPQRGGAIVRIWHGSVGDRIHVGDETARRGLALGYEDHGSPGFGDPTIRLFVY